MLRKLLSLAPKFKDFLPQGENVIMRRLYFAGFGIVSFLAPLLIFYGLSVSRENASNQQQIQTLLQQRASFMAANVELVLDQQLEKLEASAFFFSRNPSSLPELTRNIIDAGRAIRTVEYLGVANPDGTVVENSLPNFRNALPEDVRADVRRVATSKVPLIRSRSIFIQDPTVDDAGIMLYAPMTNGGRDFVLVGALTYKYVQNVMETFRTPDGLHNLNIVDNHYLLIARTADITEYFGNKVSDKFMLAVAGGRAEGSFDTVSLEGHPVLSSFKFSPNLHWYFSISIRKDYTATILARGDNFVIISAIIGLLLFVSVAIILTGNMVERQLSNQKLNDERAFSDSLKKILAERELMLREIYHRVKNNLQVVLSILRLSSKNMPTESRQNVEAISVRIAAIAEVHSLLYQANNLSFLDLKDYLEKLTNLVGKVFQKPGQEVRPILNAQSVPVSLEMAIPLGLATVELLTNSYKHGLGDRKNGWLTLNLSREKDTTGVEFGVLEIEDDGPGFPDAVDKIRSLGLKLVTNLIVDMNGTITWPEPYHSRVTVRFPLCTKTERAARESNEFPSYRHPVKSAENGEAPNGNDSK